MHTFVYHNFFLTYMHVCRVVLQKGTPQTKTWKHPIRHTELTFGAKVHTSSLNLVLTFSCHFNFQGPNKEVIYMCIHVFIATLCITRNEYDLFLIWCRKWIHHQLGESVLTVSFALLGLMCRFTCKALLSSQEWILVYFFLIFFFFITSNFTFK